MPRIGPFGAASPSAAMSAGRRGHSQVKNFLFTIQAALPLELSLPSCPVARARTAERHARSPFKLHSPIGSLKMSRLPNGSYTVSSRRPHSCSWIPAFI